MALPWQWLACHRAAILVRRRLYPVFQDLPATIGAGAVGAYLELVDWVNLPQGCTLGITLLRDLSTLSDEDLDALLLAQAKARWQKVAMVIRKACGQEFTGNEDCADRIEPVAPSVTPSRARGRHPCARWPARQLQSEKS
jgi:hypothetical protein